MNKGAKAFKLKIKSCPSTALSPLPLKPENFVGQLKDYYYNVYFKSLSYTNVLFKLEMKAQTK